MLCVPRTTTAFCRTPTGPVSTDDTNSFLDRFAHHKPPHELLQELKLISADLPGSSTDGRNNRIYEYCLDIAAACATQYSFGLRDRIIDEKMERLLKLFIELKIGRDRIESLTFCSILSSTPLSFESGGTGLGLSSARTSGRQVPHVLPAPVFL